MFKKIREKLRRKNKSPIKRNLMAKILRKLLWGMLILLTVRGIVSSIKPDQTDALQSQMKELQIQTDREIKRNTEVLSFTEDFIREWYSYTTDEDEFQARVTPYVVPELFGQGKIHDFSSTSEVNNAAAYRMEQYAANQYDVYVEVMHTITRLAAVTPEPETAKAAKTKKKQAAETPKQEIVTMNSTQIVKVPVQVTQEGRYIIEGIPLVVHDAEYLPEKYQKTELSLERIEEISLYQETITNYLKAYYSEAESVTDYYLSKEAEKEQLYGFPEPGVVELIAVNEVKAYRKAPGEVLCLVTYQIRDVASQSLSLQQCNILLDDVDAARLYIKDMNTKLFNFNIEMEKSK